MADQVAGGGVGEHGDVGYRAAGSAAEVGGHGGRHDAGLVGRLGEQGADAAAPAVLERAGCGRSPCAVGPGGRGGFPSELEQPRSGLGNSSCCSADRGDQRIGCRVFHLSYLGVDQVVAVVAGGEVQADAFGGGLYEGCVGGGDVAGGFVVRKEADGGADDVGQAAVDDPLHGIDQVGALAAGRGHVADVGAGSDAVYGFDVEGLFAIPGLFRAQVAGNRVVVAVAEGGRKVLVELAWAQEWFVLPGGPGVDVGED